MGRIVVDCMGSFVKFSSIEVSNYSPWHGFMVLHGLCTTVFSSCLLGLFGCLFNWLWPWYVCAGAPWEFPKYPYVDAPTQGH